MKLVRLILFIIMLTSLGCAGVTLTQKSFNTYAPENNEVIDSVILPAELSELENVTPNSGLEWTVIGVYNPSEESAGVCKDLIFILHAKGEKYSYGMMFMSKKHKVLALSRLKTETEPAIVFWYGDSKNPQRVKNQEEFAQLLKAYVCTKEI